MRFGLKKRHKPEHIGAVGVILFHFIVFSFDFARFGRTSTAGRQLEEAGDSTKTDFFFSGFRKQAVALLQKCVWNDEARGTIVDTRIYICWLLSKIKQVPAVDINASFSFFVVVLVAPEGQHG